VRIGQQNRPGLLVGRKRQVHVLQRIKRAADKLTASLKSDLTHDPDPIAGAIKAIEDREILS
jgi:hypothetical protein